MLEFRRTSPSSRGATRAKSSQSSTRMPSLARRWWTENVAAEAYSATGAVYGMGTNMTVTALNGSRVLFLGGGTEKGRAWGAELWNRGDESWTDAGRFAQPRTRHAATRLADGRVLVVGGEASRPTSASSMPPSMSAPRGPVLRSVELWDPKRLMLQRREKSMREAPRWPCDSRTVGCSSHGRQHKRSGKARSRPQRFGRRRPLHGHRSLRWSTRAQRIR